jgi:hypothetical protein
MDRTPTTPDPDHQIEICLVIPENISTSIPQSVRDELVRMPVEQQHQFVNDFRTQSKSLLMAYLCSLIYCHYGLLGRWAMSGWMWASLFIASTLGFIWWLIDLVRIPGMVREYNERLAVDLLRKTRIARANPAPFAHG